MENIDEFRARARAWLHAHAPRTDISHDLAAAKAFQAAQYDAGFVAITWPREHGGQALSPEHERAYHEEAEHYRLPAEPFGVGLGMCAPILRELGTASQRELNLRRILRGEDIWCQLFSEPGAGSDVASLQTRATRDDAGWVVTGQKVWTSRAHYADRGILLARTNVDVPKHQGITMFVVDMHAVGVDVRPLKDMSGGAYFNEVYFDSVRLPIDAVVGTVDDGWNAAVAMLKFERIAIGTAPRKQSNTLSVPNLVKLARQRGKIAHPLLRSELVRLSIDERAAMLLGVRLNEERKKGVDLGARGSIAKLVGAELTRRAAGLAVRLSGPAAVGWDTGDDTAAEIARAINAAPSAAIAGGTNEIQRNIIGERVLGLPREPTVDRDIAFRDMRSGTHRVRSESAFQTGEGS